MTFSNSSLLLAQESTPPAEAPAGDAAGGAGAATGQSSPFSMLPIFGLMLIMMYFIMIRPQQKRAKEHRERVETLRIGTKVISAGGIHGMVTNVSDKTVTVKVADGTKIKFEKASIAQTFPSDKGSDSDESEEEDADSDGDSDKQD